MLVNRKLLERPLGRAMRKDDVKDNVLNVMEQTEQKSAHFLDAWKRGVVYLDPELFGPGTLATAKDKNKLRSIRTNLMYWEVIRMKLLTC